MPIDQQTFDALKGLWETVGGPAGSADLAASVAFAESGGCQWALAGPVDIRPEKLCVWNETSGENSCGFWQINLYAHPTYTAPSIFDSYINARAALAISNHGTDWNAWTTYTDGAYRTYLAKFGGGTPSAPPPPTVDPHASEFAPDFVSGWKRFSHALGHDLPHGLAVSGRYRHAALATLAARRRIRH